jgi:prepilin signal peptidase PulO-like enzyme (type II secretory pathway)
MLIVLISAVGGLLLGWASWLGAAWLTAGVRTDTRTGTLERLLFPALTSVGTGGLLTMRAMHSAHSIADIAIVAILITPLVITLLTDLRAREVYPLVLLPGLLAALGIAASGPLGWHAAFISGCAAAGVAALLVVLSRWYWRDAAEAPFGSGEILIAATIGAMLGPEATPAVLFAGVMAGAVTAGLLLILRRANRDDVIPYGPFVCGAALVALAV